MLGEVSREGLVTPRGARPGDRICLTKGVPIEATALLAREFPERSQSVLSEVELRQAQGFLHNPGISIWRDAQIASQPTGYRHARPYGRWLAAALWELAEASQCSLLIDPTAVLLPSISERICRAFDIDPLASIASGLYYSPLPLPTFRPFWLPWKPGAYPAARSPGAGRPVRCLENRNGQSGNLASPGARRHSPPVEDYPS